jgi:hypothetical protein
MRGTQNECTKGRERLDGGSAEGAWPWPGQLAKRCAAVNARLRVNLVHGMLFGEHVGDDEFRVIEATVAGQRSVAPFSGRSPR